jgi:hypothetical protein
LPRRARWTLGFAARYLRAGNGWLAEIICPIAAVDGRLMFAL